MPKIAGILQKIIPDGMNHKQIHQDNLGSVERIKNSSSNVHKPLMQFRFFTAITFSESYFMVRQGTAAISSTSNYRTNANILVYWFWNLSVEVLMLPQL